MGGLVNNGDAGDVEKAVRACIFSAFSLVLMRLGEESEAAADEWLRLTAQGMGMSQSALARELYEYNLTKLDRLTKLDHEGTRRHGAPND